MGKLADYVNNQWGVLTRTIKNPLTDTAIAGVTKVLSNNPNRFEGIIVNYDAVLMRAAPSIEVSATYGIPLDPAGGFVVITADTDGETTGEDWYVYSAAGGTVYVQETVAR